MEAVEKHGNGPRPWRVRYKDNPNDPIHVETGFATKADALQWLKDNPALPAGSNSDDQE